MTLKEIAADARRQAEEWRSDPRIADIYDKIGMLAEALNAVASIAVVAPPPTPKKKGKKR